jgi:hypothetical protein
MFIDDSTTVDDEEHERLMAVVAEGGIEPTFEQ